ncbi:pirin family protein [Robertkochia aurantiaca]|uniref:pirin family protein n=1 Tax=Robertkochia aurantiaca TaxID=2873700 RepID=UPI001CCF860C|nr:pirin family protein [Robertkochia sp. 3YJGBD-33]
MKTVLHKAESRGHANHGWLDSYHSFSFANYYNPERMHFGVLRVLNDDTVAPGRGFGKHPHDNMEIISIPLYGDLEHEDSMGNKKVIKEGDVQSMTAGTGIFHSEYNHNEDKEVKFLQIWIFPKERNVAPSYDQITLNPEDSKNKLQQIVSPDSDSEGVTINQDAWFYLADLDPDTTIEHRIKQEENGVYLFVLEGKAEVNGTQLGKRDGLGISETDSVSIKAVGGSRILLMDIPMRLPSLG